MMMVMILSISIKYVIIADTVPQCQLDNRCDNDNDQDNDDNNYDTWRR